MQFLFTDEGWNNHGCRVCCYCVDQVSVLSFFYLIEQVEFFWQLLADVDLLYFHRGQPQHREFHALATLFE